MGALRLAEVTPRHVQDFVNHLQKSGAGTAGASGLGPSVWHIRCWPRRSTAVAEWRLTPINPARQGVTLPKMAHRQMQPLDVYEVKRFLAATEGDRLGPLWCLLVTTGLRRGEALGLRWRDVSLAKAQLQVRQTVITVEGQIQVSTPKTSTSRRVVYLAERTVKALELQKRRQEQAREAAGSAWKVSDLVFIRNWEQSATHETFCGTSRPPSRRLEWVRSESTICATQQPLFCCKRESTRRLYRNCSAMPGWRSPSTSTRTRPKGFIERRLMSLMPRLDRAEAC